MHTATISNNLVPHKTALGAEMMTQREAGISYTVRRLLLLANGQRNISELARMLPGQNVVRELDELAERGLVTITQAGQVPAAQQATAARRQATQFEESDLPDSWMVASNFMMTHARESLGVMSAGIVQELENASDAESARQAMSRWYRALRESRTARHQADALRLEVSQMLKKTNPNMPTQLRTGQ